jgi:ATP-dependent Clp protease ATP-binding subunit ClpA
MNNYSEEVKRAISIAQSYAKEYRNQHFSAPHLFQALLHNDVGLASYLAVAGKDVNYLRDWAEVRMEDLPKHSGTMPDPLTGNAHIRIIMELAELIRLQHNKDFIDPISVLAATLKPGIGFTEDELKSVTITQKEILDVAAEESNIENAIASVAPVSGAKKVVSKKTSSIQALYKYCVNKSQLAKDGKFDPVIGREKEIRMMAEILGRRNKPNVIITGEPGVGKSALVEGFSQFILSGNTPHYLKEAVVYELDAGALIAGASYKGETEERLKQIITSIKQQPKAILFIDEIHLLLDAKGPMGSGVANMLKPELARGEITVVGATTPDEYRKFIETDDAFSRRFEVLKVEEPTQTVAVRMVKGLLPHFEKHHALGTEPETAEEAVRLAKRYLKEKSLPDSAIDLVDKTMAAVKMLVQSAQADMVQLKQQLELLITEDHENKLEELRWFYTQLKSKINAILLNQLQSDEQPDTFETIEGLQQYLNETVTTLLELASSKKNTINKQDVAAMVAASTGIPIGKLQSGEKDKLLSIEDVIKKRVVGQDHAVKVLADAIVESRSGLLKAGQPIGSFFLLGPTGTGKTELAKSLADFLFNDESYLIRFDMSEFKEEHSAALLYGAPPGYVGYEEGGLLVNRIRQKPYSVVLFDEIEKAHSSVYDIFLQIMDEGKLHDRLGKEGDFSNVVVLFTSNIGSEQIAQRFSEGNIPGNTELMELMTRHFRPEFLARLTEIVPFAPISEQNAVKIFDIHLKSLTEPLHKQGITLEILQDARKQLALSGFSPRYGARPIKGVIRNQLRRPISRMIIAGEVKKDSVVQVALDNSGEIQWNIR